MATSGPSGSPTPPNNSGSGSPSGTGGPTGSGGPLSDATARRLAVALELLARRLGVGNAAAAAFGNRDRGGPDPVTLAAMTAAVQAGGRGRGAAGPTDSPQPVVVIGWRAGAVSVNVAGGKDAAKGTDAANSYADAMRGTGRGFSWKEMWDALKDPKKDKDKAGDGPSPAKKDEGSGVAKALASTFGRVLAPLIAFGTILSANNSGMSVFGKAVNVMATTLAPILLPPMVLMAAGILTVSDVIWEKLRPRLSDFAELVVTKLIPAVEAFVSVVQTLTGGSRSDYTAAGAVGAAALMARGGGAAAGTGLLARAGAFGASAGRFAGRVATKLPAAALVAGAVSDQTSNDSFYDIHRAGGRGRIMSFLGGALNETTAAFGLSDRDKRKAELREKYGLPQPPGAMEANGPGARAAGGQRPGEGGLPPGWMVMSPAAQEAWRRANPERAARADGGGAGGPGLAGNLEMVMRSLTAAMGPRAEYTSAAGAAKARQLAGANGDVLDMKALLRAIDSVREVTAGVRAGVDRFNGGPPTPQVPPSGRAG